MSAKDQIKAMIDQLMGSTKDGSSSKRSMTFDDPRVCKAFLLGCCPNEILAATRVDLGECHKVHDLALKADYEKAVETRKDLHYEFYALDVLEEFVADCDKKKEVLKRKLKETQEELGEEAAKKMSEFQINSLNELSEEIGTKLAKAEELGNTGEVEESMKIFKEIDELKAKKAELEQEFRNSMPASTYQQQKLRVCDVCSAYLGIHDNDRRLADHFGGKLHLGFITIREKLEELREKVKVLKEQKIERGGGGGGGNISSRKESSSSYRSDRRNDRHSSRDRRYNRRSRTRSSSRSRKSKHSKNARSRSRSPRDKHKSHRKRSSSRDRKRHKRSSRSRSSSRKQHRRSPHSKNKTRASTDSSDRSRSTSTNRVNDNV